MAIENPNCKQPLQTPKKVAIISDFSCYGRCSITVALPILAAMGIQCCPVPTAIFTNHTGYPSFARFDFTEHLDDFIREWRKLGLHFDAISVGYLASSAQLDYVRRFLDAFHDDRTLVVVDPIMGDDGELYTGYGQELSEKMRIVLEFADVLTPNMTEASVLAGRPYRPAPTDDELAALCEILSARKARRVVISGISRGEMLVNYVYERGLPPVMVSERRIGGDRCGTGDVFSSVLLGELLNGRSFAEAVKCASSFVAKAVAHTVRLDVPLPDGLAFENLLGELTC